MSDDGLPKRSQEGIVITPLETLACLLVSGLVVWLLNTNHQLRSYLAYWQWKCDQYNSHLTQYENSNPNPTPADPTGLLTAASQAGTGHAMPEPEARRLAQAVLRARAAARPRDREPVAQADGNVEIERTVWTKEFFIMSFRELLDQTYTPDDRPYTSLGGRLANLIHAATQACVQTKCAQQAQEKYWNMKCKRVLAEEEEE
jgi:hypothetical protein